jgi:hypothetical protein
MTAEDYLDFNNEMYDRSTPCRIEAYDPVNKPLHYNTGKIECIDWISVVVDSLDGMEAACIANVLKYIYRYPNKGGVEDLKKAIWYLQRCVLENQQKK